MNDRCKLSLGIIGFGAFGQLAADRLAPHFNVLVHDADDSRRDIASQRGLLFASLLAVASADIVVLCVPVRRLRETVLSMGPFLKPGAVVIDVCSVKMIPSSILVKELPIHVDIICTHPLFGPQSASRGIAGLKIIVCPVRGDRTKLVNLFLARRLALEVIQCSPEVHDREMAVVQGLTHLIAKVLVRMDPLPRSMTTPSFDHLLKAIDFVRHDSDELFISIEQDNPFAREVSERFFELASQLHSDLRTRASVKEAGSHELVG